MLNQRKGGLAVQRGWQSLSIGQEGPFDHSQTIMRELVAASQLTIGPRSLKMQTILSNHPSLAQQTATIQYIVHPRHIQSQQTGPFGQNGKAFRVIGLSGFIVAGDWQFSDIRGHYGRTVNGCSDARR